MPLVPALGSISTAATPSAPVLERVRHGGSGASTAFVVIVLPNGQR